MQGPKSPAEFIDMEKKMIQTERHIEAVLAALDLLDCFQDDPFLSTKDIINRTGFTRNRVMRIVGTLMLRGYLLQDPESGLYTPGPALMKLGKVFEHNQNIVILLRPILRELALNSGESVSLYIREGLERVVLAREEGTQAIRFAVTEGQRMDLHAGAGGKVLLAYAPPEVLDAALKRGPLPSRTPQTIVDPEDLIEELKKVRNLGYSLSLGERVPDAFAVAAPVFDSKNDLVGALGIAGPLSRFTAPVKKEYLKLILEAAENLSHQLGQRGDLKRKEKVNV